MNCLLIGAQDTNKDVAALLGEHKIVNKNPDFVCVVADNGFLNSESAYQVGYYIALGVTVITFDRLLNKYLREKVIFVNNDLNQLLLAQIGVAPVNGIHVLQKYVKLINENRNQEDSSLNEIIELLTNVDKKTIPGAKQLSLAAATLKLLSYCNAHKIDLAEAISRQEVINQFNFEQLSLSAE